MGSRPAPPEGRGWGWWYQPPARRLGQPPPGLPASRPSRGRDSPVAGVVAKPMRISMPSWLNRLTGGRAAAPVEQKAGGPQTLLSLTSLADASWSQRGFASLASEGFARNPVVYRCVRMIAEAGARVPLVVEEGGRRLTEHPLATLLAQPNPQAAGAELLEGLYAYLQTAGNAYLQAGVVDGEVKALFSLRPDRMRAVPGRDGYAIAYDYTSGGRTSRLS